MAKTSPNSVTLKINRTSVMLYATEYVRLNDGRGASTQRYLASFSKNATELPAAFATALREATSSRPERYQALIARLETEVLAPARTRRRLEELLRQGKELTTTLRHVVQGLTDIPEMPGYLTLTSSAEFQGLLSELQAGTTRLFETQIRSDAPSSELPESAEQQLQRLLYTINMACTEIAELMPTTRNAFPKGHRFAADTIGLVRNFWFRSSEAIASLSGRSQLKRPRNWSASQS